MRKDTPRKKLMGNEEERGEHNPSGNEVISFPLLLFFKSLFDNIPFIRTIKSDEL